MKKKLFTGLLATTALASLLITTTAEAETIKTDAGISFFDTNQPGPDNKFKNNLVFAWAPIEFNFGNHKVDPADKDKYYPQVIDASKKQYLAISDDRPGDDKAAKGWVLQADLDDFTDKTSGTSKLENAVLSFRVADLQKYNIDIDASDQAGIAVPNVADPTALSALPTAHASLYTKVSATTDIKLTAGDATPKDVFSFKTSQAIADTLGVAGQVTDVQLKVLDHSTVANKSYVSKVNFKLGLQP